jgi:thymidylate synthase (FAD)
LRVEIINPEVLKNLYHNHGEFACVCYDTDAKYAGRVGESCQKSGHMSGSRCEYIKFRLIDIDRGTAEQIMRHEIGVSDDLEHIDNYADLSMRMVDVSPDQIVKNMASFRYIDKTGFSYEIPNSISGCASAQRMYCEAMKLIDKYRSMIKQELVDYGINEFQATQDSNFLLPRATTSELVVGFTPEALIHFCHKRLCFRAQEFIRETAKMMRTSVAEINPRFAEELVPHCEYLLWCPEGKKSCGRKPTREQLLSALTKTAQLVSKIQ